MAWRAEYNGGPFASTQEWTTRPARRVYVFESGRRDERAPEAPRPALAGQGGEAVLGWYEPTFEEEGLRMQWYPEEVL